MIEKPAYLEVYTTHLYSKSQSALNDTTALPDDNHAKHSKKSPMAIKPWGIIFGAGHEIRTRDFDCGQVRIMLYKENITSQVLIRFMSRLVRGANCKVFLILDNLRVHHNKLVKVWREEHEEEIAVFYLPSYLPECNPEEYLNGDHKHCIRSGLPARSDKALTMKKRSFMGNGKIAPNMTATTSSIPRSLTLLDLRVLMEQHHTQRHWQCLELLGT